MADKPSYKSWQCPPQVASEDHILGFVDEACQEGHSWLKSQRCYRDYRKSLDTISGMDTQPSQTMKYRSRTNTNRLKRNIREVISVLARLKPFWGYQSDNELFQAAKHAMNLVTRSWYLDTFADRAIKSALQWSAGTARGWIHPVYVRPIGGTGPGDLVLKTYGAPSVLPSQLPSDGNFQRAYAVTILDAWPIYEAHGLFPAFQDRLVPSASKYWYQNDNILQAAAGNWASRTWNNVVGRNADPSLPNKLIPIRKTYINDLTLNTTDQPIPMGDIGSSWYYEVPYVGQEISDGNEGKTRKADANDARLYPYRRLIISSDKCKLYDGPAFDWHGMFPGVSFCLDDWPWEPNGFSLVHDGYEINDNLKEIERGVMDIVRSKLRPSMMFDSNAVTMKEMRRFDPFQPDARLGFDGMGSDGPIAKTVMDAEYYRIDPTLMAFYQSLQAGLDSQMCINDVAALAKARTVGSVDQIEKIMEMQGPIVTDMSRSMEPPLRDLGNMVKYGVLQWYDTRRVMTLIGPDNVPRETFDFQPNSIVPSHLPNEDVTKESPSSRVKRGRHFADNLKFVIQPNSLHEYQQMEYRLGLIQLVKAGVKLSSKTLAEAWSIMDYGNFPGHTEIERWQWEKDMEVGIAVRAEVLKNDLEMAGAAMSLVQPPGSAQPGKQPEGRPTTGMDNPRMVQKDGGTRTTITQAK